MTTVAEKDDVSEGIDVDVVDMESHLEEAFFWGGGGITLSCIRGFLLCY